MAPSTTPSSGLRQGVRAGSTDRLSDAEISHHRYTVMNHDVFRLDIAVYDVLPMCVIQGRRDGARDLDSFVQRQSAFTIQPRAQ